MRRFLCGLAAACFALVSTTPVIADDAPDKAFSAMTVQLSEGKLESIWGMLPASYQTEIKGLISQFAGKMDAELWSQSFATAKKLTKVLKDKKEFILSNPQMAALPIDKDTLSKGWDPLVGILDSILDSGIADLSTLKSPDPEKFLKETGSKVMKAMTEIAPLVPGNTMKEDMEDMKSASAKLLSMEGDKATIEAKVGKKEPKKVEVVKVEGKWIPKDMADEFSKFISQAKQKIDEIKTDDILQKKPALLGGMKKVGESLDKLLAAKTASEFESEIGNLVAAAQQMGSGG